MDFDMPLQHWAMPQLIFLLYTIVGEVSRRCSVNPGAVTLNFRWDNEPEPVATEVTEISTLESAANLLSGISDDDEHVVPEAKTRPAPSRNRNNEDEDGSSQRT